MSKYYLLLCLPLFVLTTNVTATNCECDADCDEESGQWCSKCVDPNSVPPQEYARGICAGPGYWDPDNSSSPVSFIKEYSGGPDQVNQEITYDDGHGTGSRSGSCVPSSGVGTGEINMQVSASGSSDADWVLPGGGDPSWGCKITASSVSREGMQWLGTGSPSYRDVNANLNSKTGILTVDVQLTNNLNSKGSANAAGNITQSSLNNSTGGSGPTITIVGSYDEVTSKHSFSGHLFAAAEPNSIHDFKEAGPTVGITWDAGWVVSETNAVKTSTDSWSKSVTFTTVAKNKMNYCTNEEYTVETNVNGTVEAKGTLSLEDDSGFNCTSSFVVS